MDLPHVTSARGRLSTQRALNVQHIAVLLSSINGPLTHRIAATFELPDYLKAQPSPSLLKREAEKNFKYSRLITVAQKQTKEKKRLHCPTFTAFIVSDFGDLSPAALELQEWLVTAYAKKCEREGTRADGCNSADLIRSFRQKFKLNVQLAIASGLGGMLLTAGQPFGHDVL